jgi:hypothetical protein
MFRCETTMSRRLYGVLIVGFVVPFMGQAANENGNLRVTEDTSLTTNEYAVLGVPDPGKEWTTNEFDQALRSLSKISRERLPRAGSNRSQVVFGRLVSSYSREFELSYRADANGSVAPPPSLSSLYSTDHADGILFDRELAIIRSRKLSKSLSDLPTRAELHALSGRFSELLKTAKSDEERIRLSNQVEKAEASASRVSAQVKRDVSDFLVIAGIPALRETARYLLMEEAEKLFLEVPNYLPEEDVRFVATLLRGVASPDFNSVIRVRLLSLADRLDAIAAHQNDS